MRIYELKNEKYKYALHSEEPIFTDANNEVHLLNNLLLLSTDSLSVNPIETILETSEHKLICEANSLDELKQNYPELMF